MRISLQLRVSINFSWLAADHIGFNAQICSQSLHLQGAEAHGVVQSESAGVAHSTGCTAAANYQRRKEHAHVIHKFVIEERAEKLRAAFGKHVEVFSASEFGHEAWEVNAAVRIGGQCPGFNAMRAERSLPGWAYRLSCGEDGFAGQRGIKHAGCCRYAAVAVNNYAQWMLWLAVLGVKAGCELRVVGNDGAGRGRRRRRRRRRRRGGGKSSAGVIDAGDHGDLRGGAGSPSPIHSAADFTSKLAAAWVRIEHRLIQQGRRPWRVIGSSDLREVHICTTLALIFEDFATRLNIADADKAKVYREEAMGAWAAVRMAYDERDTGQATPERRAGGTTSVWLG